tara:strand:- start:859 stop:1155 length:297 start_codon:yes stop_codon:yes gene_type:complete
MAKIIETSDGIEAINEKHRNDKLNELTSKWTFGLEKLRSEEVKQFTSNRVNSVACGIAADRLESCIEDLQEAKQAIISMEKYHRNCVNLINNIYNKNN